jgi:hypothetical protein
MTAHHVDANYRHVTKLISARARIELRASRLKWYDLARAETPVDEKVRTTARDFLNRAAARQDWPLDKDVGFVILHRCGEAFYFLILCTWRGNNELWKTVYFKPEHATPDFALFPQGSHKGTFCVWEAGIVAHEMAAWTRFLGSGRADADLAAYLADFAAGPVE